jgi:ribonuclease G
MAKEIIINAQPEQTRIALLENGELVELYIENPEHERTLGNIILGQVRKIMPSIQAAFIDIGQKQDAFLHFSDLTENLPEWLHYLQLDQPDISQVHRHHEHARSLRLRHRPQRPRSGGGEEFEDEEEATALEQAHVAAVRPDHPAAEDDADPAESAGEVLAAHAVPEAPETARAAAARRRRGGRRRGRHHTPEDAALPEEAAESPIAAVASAPPAPAAAPAPPESPPPAARAALPQRIVLAASPQRIAPAASPPRPPAAPEPPPSPAEPVPELYTHLRRDQRILVKISKEPISHKGSRVSTDISLAGRFLVLVPMADYVAVSKKIASFKERRRLRALAKSLLPEGFGVIVRTVAEDKNAKALDTDLRLLLEKWRKIEEQLQDKPRPPVVAYEDVNMASSVIRDLFSDDYDRILVDDQRLYRNIKSYIQAVAPDMVQAVQLHQGRQGVFEATKLDRVVAEVFDSRVNLPSGGYLYFEQTEAMHVIDVNSGRAGQGMTQEQNSRRVNLEAARIIARQLRLRDIGGIIVVDFIDMRDERNRRKLYEEIRKEFRRDRAVTKVLPMSDFGIMQITRQRLRPSLNTRFGDANGNEAATGAAPARPPVPEPPAMPPPEAMPPPASPPRPIDPEQLVRDIEQRILELKQQQKPDAVVLTVHPFTAAYLNRKLPSIPTRWWLKYFVRVRVNQDPSLEPTAWRLSPVAKAAPLALPPARPEVVAPPKAAPPPARPAGERPPPPPPRNAPPHRPADGPPPRRPEQRRPEQRRPEQRPPANNPPRRPSPKSPPARPETPPTEPPRRGVSPKPNPPRQQPSRPQPPGPSRPTPPRSETPPSPPLPPEVLSPAPEAAQPRRKASESGTPSRNQRRGPRRPPRPPSPDAPDARREKPPGSDPNAQSE